MKAGETMQLKVALTPTEANNQAVSYTSSNTAVLTVDGNGLVTAIAPGTATIKVQSQDKGKKSAKLNVTVLDGTGGDAVSGGAAGTTGGNTSNPNNDAASGSAVAETPPHTTNSFGASVAGAYIQTAGNPTNSAPGNGATMDFSDRRY